METWIHAIQRLPAEWGIFFLSMLPISELRGALPWGILVGNVPFWKAYPLAVLGNLVPITMSRTMGARMAAFPDLKACWIARLTS